MFSTDEFRELLRRVRQGDEQAAAALFRDFEPLIRREVRLRLEDQRLQRAFDSQDVCQSVLASFFVRSAMGQYDLDSPQDLVRLLVSMARNKVASAARKQNQQKRDQRRVADGDAALDLVAGGDPTPSMVVAHRELLERAQGAMRDNEREMVALRMQGASWEEIAAQLGGAPDARRIQFARAVQRVMRELGLDGVDDE